MLSFSEIDHIRHEINAFLIAGLKNGMGLDCFTLAGEISAMIASGGANPAAIMAALGTLNQINADFTAAIVAAKAEKIT